MTTCFARPRYSFSVKLGQTALAAFLAAWVALAQAPRALPPGEVPHDVRLQDLKDLDGYFPFTPAPTPEAWGKRAERVRRQLLVTLGLWPMPSKTPLNPVIHGRIDRGDYTVEKVYFESLPGFFVTGNLYRPARATGKAPGVLCPHGHWQDGRFLDSGVDATRKEIVAGAERFEDGGRSVLQSRCVQLARMGCVVFHYDMIGYADSIQISQALAHGFAKQRPEMTGEKDWGLFSPQAEAHLQSVMGLQTWNSIRSLDFLAGLPDVDDQRIGVTGASGGGTQTFILCALDPRPAVAFPAVMVSTAMQGGCTCENACGLRVDTGNVEFAALFAPKPMGMTSADDWTHEMSVKGFPELQKHYAMMGAPSNVMLKRLEHFGHNYNYVSRAAMYAWLNTHLRLGLKEPVVEEDYKRLTREEMSVWDDQHPRPASGPDFERKLLGWLTDQAARGLVPARASLAEYRRVVGGAVDVLIGRNLAESGDVALESKERHDRSGFIEMTGLLRNTAHGEEVPVVFLRPKEWKGQTVVWVDGLGKAGLFEGTGGDQASQPRPAVKNLIEAGAAVVGVDLFLQGEFVADGKPVSQTRRVKNPREAAAFTFGYNRPLFAQRVHDLLTVIRYVRTQEPPSKTLDVVGLGGAGIWVAAARAQAGASVDRAAVDTGGFRFGKVMDIQDPNFLPGGAKYGDVAGLLALSAPGALWVAGEDEPGAASVREFYHVAAAEQSLTLSPADREHAADAAVQWLTSGAGAKADARKE